MMILPPNMKNVMISSIRVTILIFELSIVRKHHQQHRVDIFLAHEYTVRENSRRTVMGVVVNHELDQTEIRVQELHHDVDVFVFLESNITAGFWFLSRFVMLLC